MNPSQNRRALCCLLALAALAACSPNAPPAGAEVHAGALRISAATSRATPIAGVTGAGYLKIENAGESDEVLLGASAEVASGVELHEMSTVDDVMRMRALPEGLRIPAGGHVELAAGGTHLMLLGVKRPLIAGEKLPVTLRFARTGEVRVDLLVQALTADEGDRTGH